MGKGGIFVSGNPGSTTLPSCHAWHDAQKHKKEKKYVIRGTTLQSLLVSMATCGSIDGSDETHREMGVGPGHSTGRMAHTVRERTDAKVVFYEAITTHSFFWGRPGVGVFSFLKHGEVWLGCGNG